MLLALRRPLLYPSAQISALGWRWGFRLQALNTRWRFPTSSLNSPIGLALEKTPSSALASVVPSILRTAASSLPHNRGISRGRLLLSKQFSKLNGWAEETQIWIRSSYIHKSMLTLNRSNEQSINTALLASFFQLIPVTNINITFTTLWYVLVFIHCLKIKLLPLPYVFQKIQTFISVLMPLKWKKRNILLEWSKMLTKRSVFNTSSRQSTVTLRTLLFVLIFFSSSLSSRDGSPMAWLKSSAFSSSVSIQTNLPPRTNKTKYPTAFQK